MTSDFIWHMEDVLDLYEQPYDPKRPVICFDERPCQLIDDAIIPILIKPGSSKKEHYEYVRNGTCCIFLAFEPHAGKRMIRVKERRTKADYADFMKTLANQYPDAETIMLVQDNLNTHTAGSFYETLPPAEAFELAKRFEYHFTPKKGSWLNMAEIELSALSKQCLDRRIPNIEMLAGEVSAWEHERNAVRATVRWKFNKCNAREKLQRHYSNLHN
jgi:DDE superfamily endonuclease